MATARNATRQQERSRQLTERLDLAREIHERVLPRLFGVSLALSASQPLGDEERKRCRVEMQEAIGELRRALERPLAPLVRDTGTTLVEELERLPGALAIPVQIDWPPWLAARSGSEHCAEDRPRTPRRARGPVPGGGVRGRRVRVDPSGLALHAGAADLGRRADVAGGRPAPRGPLAHGRWQRHPSPAL